MLKPPPDIVYLIRARLDSGRSKGAPQLNKDIRILEKALDEILRLREENAHLIEETTKHANN